MYTLSPAGAVEGWGHHLYFAWKTNCSGLALWSTPVFACVVLIHEVLKVIHSKLRVSMGGEGGESQSVSAFISQNKWTWKAARHVLELDFSLPGVMLFNSRYLQYLFVCVSAHFIYLSQRIPIYLIKTDFSLSQSIKQREGGWSSKR